MARKQGSHNSVLLFSGGGVVVYGSMKVESAQLFFCHLQQALQGVAYDRPSPTAS